MTVQDEVPDRRQLVMQVKGSFIRMQPWTPMAMTTTREMPPVRQKGDR
jgi:hypothetical protein